MIEKSSSGGVTTITLARPEVRNALNDEVMHRIESVLDQIEQESATRVVVVTGAGKAFSAGADLNAMQKIATATQEENERDAMRMGALFHRIASFPKPIVGRVNGPAMGGGVGLVAACDVVVAADSAFFAFSEVRLGLVPAVISPFCVQRLGAATARRLFLTGQRIDAAEARRLGLVDEVSSAEGLNEAVERITGDIIKGGPEALAEAKRLIDEVNGQKPEQVLGYTARCIAHLRASPEAAEGMSAFLEKRPASWTSGRE